MVYVRTHWGELKLSACDNREFYACEFVEGFLATSKGDLVK